MRYAQIIDGVVVNVIEAPGDWQAPPDFVKDTSGKSEIGGSYDGSSVFTKPVLPPPPVVDLDALDQAALNAALLEDGSVVRAIVAVMRDELNLLRAAVLPSLPALTVVQVKAALKAKMRTP